MAAATSMAAAVTGASTTTWKTGKFGLISQQRVVKPIMMRSQATADYFCAPGAFAQSDPVAMARVSYTGVTCLPDKHDMR